MRFCETHLRAYPDAHTGCCFCYEERKPAKVSRAKPKKELPKVSDKKKARERELAKVRAPKKKAIQFCQSCDTPEGPLDYSHTLSVKHYPAYEAVEANAVIECRKCHNIWENRPLKEKMKLKTWEQRLAFILANEPNHFNKMQLKSSAIK
jgi:5-methylcytosine-specific restriction endonuclease McrA